VFLTDHRNNTDKVQTTIIHNKTFKLKAGFVAKHQQTCLEIRVQNNHGVDRSVK